MTRNTQQATLFGSQADVLLAELVQWASNRHGLDRPAPTRTDLAVMVSRRGGAEPAGYLEAMRRGLEEWRHTVNSLPAKLRRSADFDPALQLVRHWSDHWLTVSSEPDDVVESAEVGNTEQLLEFMLRIEATLLSDHGRLWDAQELSPCLTPLITHWLRHGDRVLEVNDHPRPVMPTSLYIDQNEQGALGRMLLEQTAAGSAALYLPGMEDAMPGRSLPVHWWDLGQRPRQGGPGAPLGLRLMMACLMAYRQPHWHENGTMYIPLRVLMRWLWPATDLTGKKRLFPKRRQRAGFYAASNSMHTVEAMFPDYTRGKLMRLVTLDDLPMPNSANELEQVVTVKVRMPPGSTAGPRINRWLLTRLGVESAAAYRLYLNLAAHWWDPGTTRRRTETGHWYQSRNPEHYLSLNEDQLVNLSFPTSSRGQRRNLRGNAHAAVDLLQRHNVLQIVDGKLLPVVRR